MTNQEVFSFKDELIALRRDFHMYPEVGFELHRTSKLVQEYLENLGLEVKRIAKTGVVALLRGNKPGRTIMLRADMDALNLQELNDTPYRSKIEGIMHACGHDGHTAMLLVAAKILKKHQSELSGNVKFVFQPSEEKFPPGGALPMIEEGVLMDPPVDYAFGIHLWNSLECGKIGLRPGAMMAAADEFRILLKGKGGHGALPHQCKDPIVAACELVLALQTIVSRNIDPLESAVLSVGKIQSGSAFNIIPEYALIEGTTRSLNETVREIIKQQIHRITKGVAIANDLEFEIDHKEGTAVLRNDEFLNQIIVEVAKSVVGEENVVLVPPTMGGEDMSFFLQRVPGVFYLVGSANTERGINKPHHSPYFDIDERALLIGTQMHVETVFRFLRKDDGSLSKSN
ncbi:MAG TPA: amidohydrolase [Pseudothermotoga sp.]|nr:amidohydrolase [Pseudothermotoga sp.]HOK83562.1 amidohydrolase [Pseudothermotoga sp.]HPP69635.1 amidohydrolase [Pseudothermotoga sp.]